MVGSLNILNIKLADTFNYTPPKAPQRTANILICRQLTIEPIESFLKVGASASGVDLKVKFGGFDTWRQDLLDQSIDFKSLDCVFVFPDYRRILNQLRTHCMPFEQIIVAISKCLADLIDFLLAMRQNTSAKIALLTPSVFDLSQLVNGVERVKIQIWFNTLFAKWIDQTGNLDLINTDELLVRVGMNRFSDEERYQNFKLPFTEMAMRNIAAEMLISIRQSIGAQRKVLVLDCDNTLWGGICGEVERVEELTLGIDGSAATAYLRLQQTARRLKESGVLLALLSKNKESSVFKVFEEHPSMTLNKNDIAAWQVNWDNKYKNIRKLADELNLSLDAFVFIDDSKNEIDEMTHFCPEVWSIHLDQDTLSNFETIIRKLGFFEKSKITESDKLRTDHFIKEKLRVETRTNSQDYESYLNSLEMVLKTSIGLSVNKSRVEQMAARTNQMNLNNWRISNVEIDTLVYQEQKHLVSFSLIDKFGDLGDIGVLAFTIDEEKTEIELFILSCRAFGRSVEYAMLKFVEDYAKKFKCKKITAIRKSTKKNLLIMDCFDACGYTTSSIGLDYLFSKNLENLEQQTFPKLNHIQTNYEDDQKDSK
ncbi:HAD-IIIC family phosphatase [Candidatus Puniceispirillum sp.]|nr:HAD-IIIC family phosphatase [Alphaproteobacteria bacterium]MDC1293839.1 HAD-IIIC family phosphatase [Candidatus Puniceispirillum sp.]